MKKIVLACSTLIFTLAWFILSSEISNNSKERPNHYFKVPCNLITITPVDPSFVDVIVPEYNDRDYYFRQSANSALMDILGRSNFNKPGLVDRQRSY